MSSCSASIATPICLGNERFAVVPATFSDDRLSDILQSFDTIILMKVHRVLDHVISLLTKTQLLDHAVLVERAGTSDERVIDLREYAGGQPHYFSTIIIRKQVHQRRVLIN